MRRWLLFVFIILLCVKGSSQSLRDVSQDTVFVGSSFKADSIAFYQEVGQAMPAHFLLPGMHCRYFPFPCLLDPDLGNKWPWFVEVRKDGVPLKKNHANDWILLFLVFLALLSTLGLRIHPDVLQPIGWLFKKPSTYNERWRDDTQPVHVLFNLVFCCVIALVAWSTCHSFLNFKFQSSTIPAFIAVVALVYGVKSIFYRTTGLLFGFKDTLLAYLNIVFKINRCLALIMLPLVFWMFFSTPFWSKWALIVSISLFFVFLCLRFVRGMQLGSQLMASKIHFLFYLCASELLPTLVLIKFLLNE